MKFKYYLRGAGIGVITTSIILMIAFAFYQPTLSDEEIMRKAAALGMVMAEEEEEETEDNQQETETEPADETETETDGEGETAELVQFNITSGETSATVSEHLYEAGLVDDAEAFDSYLEAQGIDNLLSPGEYSIPMGSSFIEIGEILSSN